MKKLFSLLFILGVTLLAANGQQWIISQEYVRIVRPDSGSGGDKVYATNPIDLRSIIYAHDSTGKRGNNLIDTFMVQFHAQIWAETRSDNIGAHPQDSVWLVWSTMPILPGNTQNYGIDGRLFVIDSMQYREKVTADSNKAPTIINLYGTFKSDGGKPYTMPTFLHFMVKELSDSSSLKKNDVYLSFRAWVKR